MLRIVMRKKISQLLLLCSLVLLACQEQEGQSRSKSRYGESGSNLSQTGTGTGSSTTSTANDAQAKICFATGSTVYVPPISGANEQCVADMTSLKDKASCQAALTNPATTTHYFAESTKTCYTNVSDIVSEAECTELSFTWDANNSMCSSTGQPSLQNYIPPPDSSSSSGM